MKVSIVTLSFNQSRFLERAIRSVLAQDHQEVEYIVVDAGSTDGSRDVIERYQDRIHTLIFEPDEGPADGLNKGFGHATGEIYGFLNADDMLHPHAVTRFVEAFQSNKADVISGHGYLVDSQDQIIGNFYSDRYDAIAYVRGVCILVQQSTFFRADLFHRVGGFNTGNRVNWDGELWFDMARAGADFARIAGFWSYFRIHPGSISGSRRLRPELNANVEYLGKKIGVEDQNLLTKRFYWLKSKPINPIILFEKYRTRRNLSRLLQGRMSQEAEQS